MHVLFVVYAFGSEGFGRADEVTCRHQLLFLEEEEDKSRGLWVDR